MSNIKVEAISDEKITPSSYRIRISEGEWYSVPNHDALIGELVKLRAAGDTIPSDYEDLVDAKMKVSPPPPISHSFVPPPSSHS